MASTASWLSPQSELLKRQNKSIREDTSRKQFLATPDQEYLHRIGKFMVDHAPEQITLCRAYMMQNPTVFYPGTWHFAENCHKLP